MCLKPLYIGWGESRFAVVSIQNTELILIFLFINYYIFSIGTTVNLLLSHLVLLGISHFELFSFSMV